jgi:hypothetical protein
VASRNCLLGPVELLGRERDARPCSGLELGVVGDDELGDPGAVRLRILV